MILYISLLEFLESLKNFEVITDQESDFSYNSNHNRVHIYKNSINLFSLELINENRNLIQVIFINYIFLGQLEKMESKECFKFDEEKAKKEILPMKNLYIVFEEMDNMKSFILELLDIYDQKIKVNIL